MNTHHIKRSLILVILLVFAGALAFAQEPQGKEDLKDAQEEAEMKEAMEAEMRAKKEMLEQERQQMKLEQQKILEQERKMREMERRYAEQEREMEHRARELSRSSGLHSEGAYVAPVILHPNQSQLTLRNSFRGVSETSKGEFEVEQGTRSIRCLINGKVNSGEILIAVQYPDGKTFKELTINSAAEISFSQSLTIKEEEGKKYFGSWKYMVKAEKAEGSYMLQFMTN